MLRDEVARKLLSVVLIDDNPDDRALVRHELGRHFDDHTLRYVEVVNGEQFELLMAENHFDLVITDYHLNWSTGLVLLSYLKARYPEIPVLMFTATGSEEVAVQAMKMGLDDYIVKSPQNFVRLRLSVQKTLGYVAQRQAAQRAEQRYRGLYDGVPIGLYRSTADGQIIDVNSAFVQLLGYPEPDNLIGVELPALYASEVEEDLWETAAAYRQPVLHLELQLRRYDGSAIWVEVNARHLHDEQENLDYFEGSIIDISRRKTAEERLMFLSEASVTLTASLDYRSIVQDFLKLTIPRLADCCAIQLLAEGRHEYESVVAHVDPEKEQQLRQLMQDYEPNLQADSPPFEVLRTQHTFLMTEVAEDDNTLLSSNKKYARLIQVIQPKSYIVTPLRARGQIIGILTFAISELSRCFSIQDVEFIEDLASRTATAIDNARLHAQAQEHAAQEERQRLARELHDAVSQTLFTSSIIAESTVRIYQTNPDQVSDLLEQLHRLNRAASAEMRNLLVELRPAALREQKISSLVKQLAHAVMGRKAFEVALDVQDNIHLPEDVQVMFYRVAQESLNNIVKHAEAENVLIRLKDQAGVIELHITDDGRGFDINNLPARGMGLHIMQERAHAVGADLNLHSQPGKGTTVSISWVADSVSLEKSVNP